MTKDEMIEQVNQRIIEENYDLIQNEIKKAMYAKRNFIFATKPGHTDIYEKFEEILWPVTEMLEKDGFNIDQDTDNPDYLKISW